MAKISLDKIYKTQLKTKIIGVAVVLLIAFASFEFIISRNPGRARATVTISGTNTIYNNSLNGAPAMSNSTDLVINGGTTTMSGVNTFNSLTINSGATVNHRALTTADFDIISGSDPLKEDTGVYPGIGKAVKVDITVAQDLTINSGGKIDVSYKGYPGGTSGHKNGYGPGYSVGDGIDYSGGAGYGGNGGTGKTHWTDTNERIPGGISYGDQQISQLYHGSGSGHTDADGASGGGIVNLTIGNNLVLSSSPSIIANGKDSDNGSLTQSMGGGSGGSVRINFLKIPLPTSTFKVTVAKGAGGNGVKGTIYSNDSLILYSETSSGVQITANGGEDKGLIDDGSGGGGRVALLKIDPPPVIPSTFPKITKTLAPISRKKSATETITCGQSGQPADCFNPHALQKDDVIKVTLTVTGVATFPFYLEDPLLEVKEGATTTHQCGSPGSFGGINTAPTPLNDQLAWTLLTNGMVSYQCTIN